MKKIMILVCCLSFIALKADSITVSSEEYNEEYWGNPDIACQRQGAGMPGRILFSPECNGGDDYVIDCGM